MAEIIGRQLEVGLAVESTRGTAKVVAESWLRNVSANIVDKAEFAQDNSVRGRLEDMDGRRLVKQWVEGDMEGIVGGNSIGYFLYNLYGSETPTLVTAGVYSHVFALSQTIIHNSLTLFVKDGSAQQLVANNCMLSSFELTASPDEYVRYKASWMGKTTAANAASPSYVADSDFIGKEVVIKIATTEAGLTGASPILAKEVNLKFDTGLISDFVLGSLNPNDVYNAKLSIEGSFKKNFVDQIFKTLYLSDTYSYMSITITGSTLIAAGHYPTITIILNKVAITDWNRSGGADEMVIEDVSFKTFYNPTDTESSAITLKSATAEYNTNP